jgi:glutamate-ammonia-ligase adenylyltransferase
LPASGYYIRLTQRIVSALTSLSQQGRLFDVDLRLRPNGDKGGLACSIEAFEKYQLSDAWTWEHMALTRARLIYGAPATQDALHRAIQTALNKPRDGNSTLVAIANMRGKMRQSQDSTGVWNIKRVQGGLIDVEFIVQYLLLRDPGICDAADPGISAAIDRLCAAKALTVDQANTLRQAFELWSRLMTMLRLTLPNVDAKPPFPAGLAAKLASATQMNDIEALEGHMKVTASKVAAIYDDLIDRPAAAVRTTFGDNQPH